MPASMKVPWMGVFTHLSLCQWLSEAKMGSPWKSKFKWLSLEDLCPDPMGQPPSLPINPTGTKTQDKRAQLERGMGAAE